jgi:hypothetical protein
METVIPTHRRTESGDDWCEILEKSSEWVPFLRPASRMSRIGISSADLAEIKKWDLEGSAYRAGIGARHRTGARVRLLTSWVAPSATEVLSTEDAGTLVPLRARGIPFRLRIVAIAKLLIEAFAHPLTTSYLGIDLEHQTVVVKRTLPASKRMLV